MSSQNARLYLLCGKIASGKSTLAKKLSEEHNAILISQDEWLSALYPNEINSLEDYARSVGRLADVMGRLVAEILSSGTSVVLDFPANTIEVRRWMKKVARSGDAKPELHFLDTSDERCLERVKLRNESGDHEYKVSEEEYARFSSYFVAPQEREGFHPIVHKSS